MVVRLRKEKEGKKESEWQTTTKNTVAQSRNRALNPSNTLKNSTIFKKKKKYVVKNDFFGCYLHKWTKISSGSMLLILVQPVSYSMLQHDDMRVCYLPKKKKRNSVSKRKLEYTHMHRENVHNILQIIENCGRLTSSNWFAAWLKNNTHLIIHIRNVPQ